MSSAAAFAAAADLFMKEFPLVQRAAEQAFVCCERIRKSPPWGTKNQRS